MMSGNTIVLSHSKNVTGSAFAIGDAFKEAGFPLGAFVVINVATDTLAGVIADNRIAAITLTGSVRAGRAVASESGKVLKKCMLELGGYRVGGMPDGTTARIANFGAPIRNDWRIMRIKYDNTHTGWSGHYENVEEALAALQQNRSARRYDGLPSISQSDSAASSRTQGLLSSVPELR